MRKNYLLYAVLILAALSSAALADDKADYYLIGFSQTGSYFAFEEYGVNDDADNQSPYSWIYIIKVGENTLAIPKFNANGVSKKEKYYVRRIYGQSVKQKLKRFGIIEENLGSGFTVALPVIDSNSNNPEPRPRTGKTLPPDMEFTSGSELRNGERNFEVKLTPVLLPRESCDGYKRDMYSFEIKLWGEKDKVAILQKTGDVLKAFGCTDAYGIDQVSVYRNKFVAVIAGFTQDSKGPDNRYLVVTGIIPGK